MRHIEEDVHEWRGRMKKRHRVSAPSPARAPKWTLSLWWRAVVLTIDTHVYRPHHGPQDWENARARYYVSIVRTESLLREDRERSTHFSFNIWIYSERGAWCWNLAFKKGARRFGVEPRYANDGVGGMEVGEYIDALQARLQNDKG